MNHIIPTVNVLTIFRAHPYLGRFLERDRPNFSDIGRTRTDLFLKLAPLRCTQPLTSVQHMVSGSLAIYKISLQSIQTYLRNKKGCASSHLQMHPIHDL